MAKQAKLAELKEDLAEYNRLCQIAERPRVKQLLKKQIRSLSSEQLSIEKQLELQKNKPQQKPEAQKQQTSNAALTKKESNVIYTALTKYSWEDESKKAKIYFTLQNIGNESKADQIDVEFKPHSVQLKIRNYRKQNLLFTIKKTCGEIVPEQSNYLVKTNLLSITLAKKSSGTWKQLNFKEDKFATKEKQDPNDPNSSIMSMMKNMYEQGDETMKKTIAEAWTKSRDKGANDSLRLD